MTSPKLPSQDFDHSKPLPPITRFRADASGISELTKKRQRDIVNKQNIQKQIKRGLDERIKQYNAPPAGMKKHPKPKLGPKYNKRDRTIDSKQIAKVSAEKAERYKRTGKP